MDEDTRRIIGAIDLTNLELGADPAEIETLCAKAKAHGVAAVCVYAEHVALCRRLLAETPVKVATVLNFPAGTDAVEAVLAEAAVAVAEGAEELDLVIPYAEPAEATRAMVRAVKAAHPDLPLKVILETGAQDADGIRGRAAAAVAGGADFLKTSTGKIPAGASPEASVLLLEAIAAGRRPVGLKVSGGIRTREAALGYLRLAQTAFGVDGAGPAHFRIGCSGLLDVLLTGGTARGY